MCLADEHGNGPSTVKKRIDAMSRLASCFIIDGERKSLLAFVRSLFDGGNLQKLAETEIWQKYSCLRTEVSRALSSALDFLVGVIVECKGDKDWNVWGLLTSYRCKALPRIMKKTWRADARALFASNEKCSKRLARLVPLAE